ncbi:MAG: alpha/beta hydrolase [Caldilineales bacterium]|nr:alpha/beta hydrolase [Caldilineales bacterium]
MRTTITLPDDAIISYLDLGSGPPMLMLHGFTGTARRHLGALIDHFAKSYHVIAPDLRGYGASRPPNRDFPPDFYPRDADDMAALLDALDLGPAIVLGFSDGAESAILLAASRHDLVRAVVAWGVSGRMPPEHLAAVENGLPVSAWGPERAVWRANIIADHGEEQLEPMIEGWVRATEAIAAAGGNICMEEASDVLCPVLLINGEGEVGNLPEDVERLAARISDCRLEFVAGTGHWVHTEQSERFVALMEDFLGMLDEGTRGR